MTTKNRPGRTPHICLQRLRKATGLTQQALADQLGVSTAAIIAVENGYLGLSDDMKKRLMVLTNVDPASLDRKKPVFIGERSYKREMFEKHRQNCRTRKLGEDEAELRDWQRALQRQAMQELEALINAAAHANKFDLALYTWKLSLEDTLRDLKLSGGFAKALEKLGIESTASSFRLSSTPPLSKRPSDRRKSKA